MSRDSSGTYTAPSSSVNPAVEGTTIDETDFNALVDDIETALTDSLDRTGKGKITAHIDFDETTVSSPSANVGRLYAKDVGGVTSLFFKDSGGTDTNLLLSSPGLAYTFSTVTTMADPGSGYIRFNNSTLTSVTAIAIDDNDANAADLSTYVLTWDDVGTSDRGTLIIQNRTSPGSVVIFTISGASTDNSGWTQLVVTYVTHAGSFGADAPLAVQHIKPGTTGATGATGATGLNGTDPGIRWLFDSSTTMADPGAGDLRLNNSTLSSVTEIAISDNCGETGNPSVETFVLAWDDSTSTSLRGTLIIKKASAPENFAVYSITGASTDNSGWTQLAVTHVVSSGSFSSTDVLAVQFIRTGDKGADGAGTGDVVGPASATNGRVASFDGTTGKLIADSGVLVSAVSTAITQAGTALQAADIANMLETSDIGVSVQGYDADTLKSDATKTLTTGYATTPYNAGTKSSGTYTPAESDGAFQYATNGGAHTLAPPTNNTSIIVQYTNNGSAGTITTSGFTKVTGSFSTTNGDDFFCYITKNNGFSHLHIQALQ